MGSQFVAALLLCAAAHGVAAAPASCQIKIEGICVKFPLTPNAQWFEDSNGGGPNATTAAACLSRDNQWKTLCQANVEFKFTPASPGPALPRPLSRRRRRPTPPPPGPGPVPPPPGPVPPPPGSSLCDDDGDWKLVWQDEFDAPSLNSTVWTVPTGVGSSFGRDANVTEADTYLENGMLVLRSQKMPNGKNYTTGAAITHQHGSTKTPGFKGISWQYGRFCVRAKLPGAGPGKSQGLWPAHWMMPADYSRHCGYNELDIMEMVNGGGTAYGTYWYWGPNGGGAAGSNCTGPPVKAGTASVKLPDYHSAFHEYAIEWTPSGLTYFVDSKKVCLVYV
jgi:hypothetical protein